MDVTSYGPVILGEGEGNGTDAATSVACSLVFGNGYSLHLKTISS